jgi:hypothetical protein
VGLDQGVALAMDEEMGMDEEWSRSSC